MMTTVYIVMENYIADSGEPADRIISVHSTHERATSKIAELDAPTAHINDWVLECHELYTKLVAEGTGKLGDICRISSETVSATIPRPPNVDATIQWYSWAPDSYYIIEKQVD